MKRKYNYISLFSSAGVGCYGFKMEDFECIATNELIESRMQIQIANKKCKYPSGYITGDITKEDTKAKLYKEIHFWQKKEKIEQVDVVIATPPCQGMSTANYKKKNEIKRNSLVVEAIDIIEKINPKIFVFENVSAFMKSLCIDKDESILSIKDCIYKHLSDNYNIYYKVVNFKDYGVPSSRPRTLVIGTLKSLINLSPLNIFPMSKNQITVRDVIKNLPKLEFGEIDSKDIYHAFRKYPEYMREWIHSIKEGESAFSISNPVKPYKIVNGKRVELKGSYMGNKFRRMFWDQPAPCIATRNDQLASQSTIHPEQDRVLSIRELMRVMSIPDSFVWTDKNTLGLSNIQAQAFLKKNELNIRRSIGEAVPTEIMRQIAHNIKEMFDFDYYIKSNDDSIQNFYVTSYKVEMGLDKVKDTGAFYTPQSVVFDTIKNIKIESDSEIKILEPSIGMGAFLPQLFRLVGECGKVVIDAYDIDSNILDKLKQSLTEIGYTKNNIVLNCFCEDFLTAKTNKQYDLVIGNPPYVKLVGKEIAKYRQLTENKTMTNMFGFFLDKVHDLSNEIAFIIPKTFLMTPEFNELREKFEKKFNVVSITDYGVCFFKTVFVEIISIHFKKSFLGKVLIDNKRDNFRNFLDQGYIYHDKCWLIYRNKWFDDYIKTLKLDVYDFYRDRQITNKYLLNTGKIRVLKSKNLLENGEIINIINYDKYINDIDMFNVKKYMNENNIIITNFTYNIRATYLPNNSIVNGSFAVLTLKNENDRRLVDLALYSTPEFRKYYAIVKNNSKFTINIDSNSVYYIGVKYDK